MKLCGLWELQFRPLSNDFTLVICESTRCTLFLSTGCRREFVNGLMNKLRERSDGIREKLREREMEHHRTHDCAGFAVTIAAPQPQLEVDVKRMSGPRCPLWRPLGSVVFTLQCLESLQTDLDQCREIEST